MSDFLVQHGIGLAIGLAVVSLIVAVLLIFYVRRCSAGSEKMREVTEAIRQGAQAYLRRQVLAISIIAFVLFLLILWLRGWSVSLGFVLGAACSLIAGQIGMRVAVLSNARVAQAASSSQLEGARVAFNGGAVTGMLVAGLGLLAVGVFYLFVQRVAGPENWPKEVASSLIGLALGSSLISVFARLGGGIYTKAADVGADLVGKLESGLEEDDPRNPAVVADNVGDNVGDCAGMAADVFETYAVALIGGVLVGFLSFTTMAGVQSVAMMYPLVLGGLSIIGAVLGILYINLVKGKTTNVLIGGVATAGLVSAILYWPVTKALFPSPVITGDGRTFDHGDIYIASLVGLVMTAVVVLITNYYTSSHYRPVLRIAEASRTGHATNIIAGLAVGHKATVLPVAFIALAIWVSYHFAGLYGTAIAVVSMLSMAGIIISLDSFGPITDNAGAVAVTGGMDKEVRKATDALDAVGNTMKAVTKGYAIASAGLAALVLFGSYVDELRVFTKGGEAIEFLLEDPMVIIGLFIGGLLPFWFTAFAMEAVGKAAGSVILEVRRQLKEKPGLLEGTAKPDYAACVDIVTRAALRQMIVPALLPLVVCIGTAWLLGPIVLGALLVGTIVTGLFVAIAMTSGGGAWDNAKKYIEEGNFGGKGSDAHAAAVTGDTVGDPYKDTAGPAINPMIKVVNVVAILLIPIAVELKWDSWTQFLPLLGGGN